MVSTGARSWRRGARFSFHSTAVQSGDAGGVDFGNQVVDGQQVSTLEAAARIRRDRYFQRFNFPGTRCAGLAGELRETLGSLPTDAQTAIQFVRSAPGITTALVGMSSLEHVEENLQLARVAPVALEQFMQLFSSLDVNPQIAAI